MSMSRSLYRLSCFAQKRPVIFNSMVYGFLYTTAEFVQQSYNKMFKLSQRSTFTDPRITEETIHLVNTHGPILIWIQRFSHSLGLHDQNSSKDSAEYNWAQLKRYAIYGCLLAGPILHGWYKWLDSFYSGKSARVVLKKLCFDQFILTPPLIILFFVSMSLMEGRSDILGECKAKFLRTFQTSCVYWLPVQLINFMLIPPALRVSFVSVAAFCWVNILCYLKSRPLPECNKQRTK